MVGMPFPNPTDPELSERMRFLDNSSLRQTSCVQDVATSCGPEAIGASLGLLPSAAT
jgi:hypothetical protein